jgi:hypothetical protein
MAHRIVDEIKKGATRVGAAKSAGIGRSTLYEWLELGRAGEEPFADFTRRVREADGKAQTAVEAALYKSATEGSVPAQSFWLKARAPREWAGDGSTAPTLAEADVIAANDEATLEAALSAARSRAS